MEEIINFIEWQDIFEGKQLLFDTNGNTYEWDSSKSNEIGTLYGYTLILSSKKSELIEKVLEQYVKDGQ